MVVRVSGSRRTGDDRLCVCGCVRFDHLHFHRRTYCATCGRGKCARFRPAEITWPEAYAAAVPILLALLVVVVLAAMLRGTP